MRCTLIASRSGIQAWGDSACPLLWSHATYLSLCVELEREDHAAS